MMAPALHQTAIFSKFSADAIVLSTFFIQPEGQTKSCYYVTAEMLTPASDDIPVGLVAAPQGCGVTVDFNDPLDRRVFEAWSIDRDTNLGVDIPWAKPGWRQKAAHWIRESTGQSSVEMIPLRTWQRSTVIAVRHADGTSFFKAVPRMFRRELSVIECLSRSHPHHLPRILASHPGDCWMLMEEIDGVELKDCDEIEVWESAIRHYARLQKSTIGSTASELRTICPDYTPGQMESQVDSLSIRIQSALDGLADGVTAQELEQLASKGDFLKQICKELDNSGLPHVLEHGDFQWRNILIQHGAPIFIDWSEACITTPFAGMAWFMQEDFLPDWLASESSRERLWQAYTTEWCDYASPGTLSRLAEISVVFGCLWKLVVSCDYLDGYQSQTQGKALPVESLSGHVIWQEKFELAYQTKQLLQLLKTPHTSISST
ncbi:MAG: phosphotransferase [Capsulimonas sp.]